ncbi:MAG: polysaccharide pyruvyl transferase family protein [Thauera sp.]|nr:polysaccharide pyruvyl transferase family protein [Thauera sp.]
MPALSLRQPRTRDAGPVDPAIAAGRARPSPLILFGAFDRHNLGDLLLGRIAGALAEASAPGRPLLFAGAASRDLREAGGEQVHGLDALIEHWQRESAHDPQRLPPDLLQAGGEILGCTAWEAAVMLETPDRAAALIRAHDRDLAGREAWARQHLGITRALPYLASGAQLPGGSRIAHTGSGGVGFAHLPAAVRSAALTDLATAAVVHVRDRRTQDTLAAAGIEADLTPDPAVLVARVLGTAIGRHAAAGEAAAMRERFPSGWIAIQVSAEFGDDATLDTLAAGLDRLQRDTGLGLVMFCAGRAPWHDDPAVLHRLRARLAAPADCIVAASTSLLELCALLAGCTLFLASSLTCAHRRRSLRPPCGESRPGLRARTGRQAARLPRDLAWRLASPPPPRGGGRDRGSGRGAGRARACTSCPRGRAGRTRRNCVPALPRRAHPQLTRTGSNPEDLWPSTDLQVPGM